MKSWPRALAIALLVLTLGVAVLITLAWFSLPLDGIMVTVHGQTFSLADLSAPQVAVWLCVAVAVVVLAVVVALILIALGLAIGALGLAFGLLTAAASLAFAVSPLALIGWLLWRLFRERPAPAAPVAS